MLMLIAAGATAAADLLGPSRAGTHGGSSSCSQLSQPAVVKLFIHARSVRTGGTDLEKWRQSAAPCPLRIFLKMQILCDKRKRTPRAAAAFSSMTDGLIVAQNEFCRMSRAPPLPHDSGFSW